MRTARVLDTGNIQMLPSTVGKFPSFSTFQFVETFPTPMKYKSRLLMPMYPREAMFITLNANLMKDRLTNPVTTKHMDHMEGMMKYPRLSRLGCLWEVSMQS